MKATDSVVSPDLATAILESVPAPIAYVNPSFVLTYVNPAGAQLLGGTVEDLTGISVYDTSGEDSDVYRSIKRVLETGETSWDLVDWTNAMDPSIHGFWMQSMAPDKDESGQVRGVFVLSYDVTELVGAERASQEHLRKKDEAIRRAYVDVIGAVTGGRLLLMSSAEIQQALGAPVDGERAVRWGEMGSTIEWLEAMLAAEFPGIPTATAFRDACAEALANAVKHAGGGMCELYRREAHAQFRVSDHGPGIDFAHLPKATLQSGYSSVGTLGIGFSAMLKDCERVLLATGQDGTTVVLEVPASGEHARDDSE